MLEQLVWISTSGVVMEIFRLYRFPGIMKTEDESPSSLRFRILSRDFPSHQMRNSLLISLRLSRGRVLGEVSVSPDYNGCGRGLLILMN